jgi:AraC-like DNA-binding protein
MAASFRDARAGTERLDALGHVPRHRHREAYAAIVLAGGYEEAGDSGRWRVSSGQVLVHDRLEAHQDRVGARGCTLVNLAITGDPPIDGLFRIDDPDALVRLAETDKQAALSCLFAQVRQAVPPLGDWPDLLARRLGDEESFSIAGWAEAIGLAAASVSRGFRRAYGVSPRRYRLEIRARRALKMIEDRRQSLAAIAQECGFADQPHLTRTLSSITGRTPGQWREASIKSVQ